MTQVSYADLACGAIQPRAAHERKLEDRMTSPVEAETMTAIAVEGGKGPP
jgi:hypothetical protein